MAVLAAAQLLDELMGRNRNTNPNEKAAKLDWEDPQYCKYYMVKFCPHDLFVNTRADLGACPRIHDDEVKQLFVRADAAGYKKTYYQDEFLRFCQNMIGDVERKIQKGKQRLELMNSKSSSSGGGDDRAGGFGDRHRDQIKVLAERVAKLVEEAEQAGTRGDVDQAQALMSMCDQLKEERERLLQKQKENSHWNATAELAAAQEKQMEVCTVCGAFLIVGDAQQRIDDHLMGKQHVGYLHLREAFDEITAEREKQRSEKEKKRNEERDRSRGTRDRDRDRDRDRRSHRGQKDHERDRDRDRDRERNGRSHRSGREEKPSSKPRESRDKDKKHRSDKEKGPGRERSRDREGGRRKRSRSRGR